MPSDYQRSEHALTGAPTFSRLCVNDADSALYLSSAPDQRPSKFTAGNTDANVLGLNAKPVWNWCSGALQATFNMCHWNILEDFLAVEVGKCVKYKT